MDAYILIAIAFIAGLIIGAVIVEALVAKRLNQTEAENAKLKGQVTPFDRDGDGRIGGSKPARLHAQR